MSARSGRPGRGADAVVLPVAQAGRAHGTGRGRRRAAWAMVALPTVCAELTFTAVAVPQVWTLLPLLLLMYGAGVLLIREAVVRVGGGWPSLVALGLAYQLAEDGLGLQALTSPHLYGAADWGWRALGVNWTYWESQIGVHLVLSVLLPVMLGDLLFPHLRGRAYLRPGGLVVTGVLAVVGVLGLRLVIAGLEDPGYAISGGWTAALLIAIAALVGVGLGVLPRRSRGRVSSAGEPAAVTPSPRVVGVVAGLLTLAFLGLLLPIGLGQELVLSEVLPDPLRLLVGALVGVALARSVLRWRWSAGWDDQRRLWLAGGILVAHTAVMMPGSPTSATIGALTIGAQVGLLALLARHRRRRPAR